MDKMRQLFLYPNQWDYLSAMPDVLPPATEFFVWNPSTDTHSHVFTTSLRKYDG